MRKFLAFMLLAGAAAPALAAGGPGDRDHPRWSRSDSSDKQEARQQTQSEHRERSGGSDRPHFNAEPAHQSVDVDRSVDVERNRGGRGLRTVQPEGSSLPTAEVDEERKMQVRERQQLARERFAGPKIVTPEGGETPRLRQTDRALPRVLRTRTPIVSNIPREGTQPPLRTESRHASTIHADWRNHWRSDHKYDWRKWRHRHRSIFHLGFYYDPFGWDYRPYSIGWRLWPSYYSSRFWINDPWYYRLPYAPPGYRWIRYWDDAILVDTFTGEVVDVIYNFFW